nr:EOG090X0BWU [Sida crystallina]
MDKWKMEGILDELNDYEKRKTDEIPKALEEYLAYLAKTGDTLFLWPKIKWLVRHKLELVISLFRESCPTENLPPCPNVEPFHYETMRDKILEQFDSFTCAPFTIQRLCELLCSPRKHYKRTDKFMRGIEKNLLVVSTVDPEKSTHHFNGTLCRFPISAHVGLPSLNFADFSVHGQLVYSSSPNKWDTLFSPFTAIFFSFFLFYLQFFVAIFKNISIILTIFFFFFSFYLHFFCFYRIFFTIIFAKKLCFLFVFFYLQFLQIFLLFLQFLSFCNAFICHFLLHFKKYLYFLPFFCSFFNIYICHFFDNFLKYLYFFLQFFVFLFAIWFFVLYFYLHFLLQFNKILLLFLPFFCFF